MVERKRLPILIASVALAAAPLQAVLADTHQVLPGETLSHIADEYGMTVDDLASLNGIHDPDLIYAGQRLQVSAGSGSGGSAVNGYSVNSGDTLWDIASRFGVSVQALID